MSDNPFAEPGNDDRTIIVPRSALPFLAPHGPDQARNQAENRLDDWRSDLGIDPGAEFASLPTGHASPILAAATPLLSLVARLRNLVSVPDPAMLRADAVTEVRRYEQVLRDKGIPIDLVRMSHYALCASLDDVVQNTPWGSRGPWADASLVSTFHQEVRSGDRFFELLTRLRESPARFLSVIELMYLCMSLGMRGRYRLSPRGLAEHERVREDTYLVVLQQRGAAEKALSPQWRGVSAPYRAPGTELPLWLTALVAAGLVGGLFVWATLDLNRASDDLFDSALQLPPATMPNIARTGPPREIRPVTTPPGDRETLARLLAPEIREQLATVTGTEAAPVIRIESTGMFAVGSAELLPRFDGVLDRIATALRARGGPVHVIGYTDSQPVHTMAFPSNFQLSLARARVVATALGRTVEPGRVTVEGRADADPIASNTTEAGRRQNRRVEIVCGPA